MSMVDDSYKSTKWFVKSKSMWGIVIMLWPSVAPMVGLDPTFNIVELGDAAYSWVDQAFGLFGAGVAIWGRFSADSKVTVLPKG